MEDLQFDAVPVPKNFKEKSDLSYEDKQDFPENSSEKSDLSYEDEQDFYEDNLKDPPSKPKKKSSADEKPPHGKDSFRNDFKSHFKDTKEGKPSKTRTNVIKNGKFY